MRCASVWRWQRGGDTRGRAGAGVRGRSGVIGSDPVAPPGGREKRSPWCRAACSFLAVFGWNHTHLVPWFLRPFSQGLALTDRLSTGVRTTLKTYTEQSIRRPVCVTRRRRHHGARSRWRESAPACRGGAPARLFCVERTKCSL